MFFFKKSSTIKSVAAIISAAVLVGIGAFGCGGNDNPADGVGTKYAVTVVSEGAGAAGEGEYKWGATVNINAGTPPVGKRFKQWIAEPDDANFANPNSAATSFATFPNAVTVTAVFDDADTYDITMTNDGNGSATASPNPAFENTTITITAASNEGYKFDTWVVVSGGALLASATTNPTTFTMPGNNVTIRATFEALPPDTPNLEFVPAVAGSGGDFGDAEFGYTQPAARTINLHNSGTGAATVASWASSGSISSFTVTGNTGTPNIAVNGSHALTVRPNANLAAGTYTATITVTYDDGETATLNLSFRVDPIDLSGDVSISFSGTYPETGVTLTANYDGSESINSYQWKRDGIDVGTNSATFVTTQTGTYTVTVGAANYNSKTSDEQIVYEPFVYVVTAGGGSYQFVVTRAGVTVGDADLITTKMTHIRTDANGEDCTIQFGATGATTALSINTMLSFVTATPAWGDVITLTGSLTSSFNNSAIQVQDDVSLIVKGSITNSNSAYSAILHGSSGTVTVVEGAQVSSGAYSLNGVQRATILITGNGGLTMTGGLVRNTRTDVSSRVIYFGTDYTGTSTINGGEVRASSDTRVAIENASTNNGTVTVNIPPTVVVGTISDNVTCSGCGCP